MTRDSVTGGRHAAQSHTDGGIDWAAAVQVGQRLAPRGPEVTAAEARASVEDLRRYARAAELHVRETTGLGRDLPVAEAEVVDRRGWIAAAAQGMAELTRPLTDAVLPADAAVPGGQIGVLLAYLSGRVLGQYDPVGTGRLLLIAPNVIKVERELGADPADFRLWVCLHESTHRLQFSAVPWMTGYFRGLVDEYASVAPSDSSQFLKDAIAAIRRKGSGTVGDTWIRRIQSPEQQAVFDRLMALMTLLEGHADVVMDAVGPQVVPTVDEIRLAFDERRRKRRGPLDRFIRSLMGMDAKMAQYQRGAAFVRAVVDAVGMTRFNTIFTSADTLPTVTEIDQPRAWINRVL